MGQWWLDAIGNALDERNTFERMGSRQLAGLLICLWYAKIISDLLHFCVSLLVAGVPDNNIVKSYFQVNHLLSPHVL